MEEHEFQKLIDHLDQWNFVSKFWFPHSIWLQIFLQTGTVFHSKNWLKLFKFLHYLGDPSPSKFSTTTTSSSLKHSPQSGSYWGRPGSRSGIVHRSQVTSQSTPKSSSNNRPPSRASNISSSISLQTSKNHSQHMSPSPSPCSVQSSNQSSSSLNNSRSLSNNPRTSKDAVDSAKTKDPPGGDGPPNSSSNSKNGGGSKSAVWYEYGCV